MALAVCMLVAMLATLSSAASEEPFAIPGFPLAYASVLSVGFANDTEVRILVVDIENQRERISLGGNAYIISYFERNHSYYITADGNRQQCVYFNTVGTVNGSLSFPSVLSYATVGTATMDGFDCKLSHGIACIQISAAPIDPTKSSPAPFCSNFTYYAQVQTDVPVRLVVAHPAYPGRNIVDVHYRNLSLGFNESSFQLPPASTCSPYHTCNTTCPAPGIHTIFGIPFCNVALIPSWILAVLIGLCCSHAVLKKVAKGVVGRAGYAISFGAYAFMMTSGFVVHCVFLTECGRSAANPKAYALWLLIDEGMTSSIATSFFFNGLIDLKPQLLSEKNPWTYALMLASYVTIFYGYIATSISSYYLYQILIFVTCGGYCLMQVIVLLKRGSFYGFIFAVIAGLAGFIGLYVPANFYCWFCAHFGSWILEPFWYYLSDLSVFFVFLFVMHTRQPAPPPSLKCDTDCTNKHELVKMAASLLAKPQLPLSV